MARVRRPITPQEIQVRNILNLPVINRAALAREIGITVQAINHYKQGKNGIPFLVQEQVLDYFERNYNLLNRKKG